MHKTICNYEKSFNISRKVERKTNCYNYTTNCMLGLFNIGMIQFILNIITTNKLGGNC